MALYNERETRPETRMDADDMVRPVRGGSWGAGVVLVILLALGAWYSYGRLSPTVDTTNTGASTISEPVTSPNSPNASPTHPAPSPNPGP